MKKGFHWILEGETSKLCVMYRTLVFGADGRVGSRLAAYLEEHGLEVVKCGRGFCDLKDLSALKRVLLSSGATHVVNCAAVSGLEACLDDPETAHRVNAMAPEMMARICRLEGMRFIHLSTDYVLDGRREGLKTEEGKCRTVNVYGESKLEAEFRVREEMPDALIARVSWVFGNPERPSFPEMVLRRAMKREPLAAVADKWSMPTWLEDLCAWLRFLAYESGASGVLHLCQSGEPVSWHSYAVAVLKCAVKHGLLPSLPPVDDVYIALGTTMAAAGGQNAFRAIDYSAVLATTQAARRAGATRCGVVSAMGADPQSRIFYSRIKGEMERDLQALGFSTLVIARPSVLAGNRQPLHQTPRRGESLSLALLQWLRPLIPANYRAVAARDVAHALVHAVRHGTSGVQVLSGRALQSG